VPRPLAHRGTPLYSACATLFVFFKTFLPKNLTIQYKINMRRPKKSKYKSVVIKKKRYYFYEITWIDPTGDSGHATAHDSLGLLPATMITHAYLFDKNKKYIWTFASYEKDDELFSDRNVFPRGCIIKMEKVNER